MKEYEYTGKAMGTDYAISIICDSEELSVLISNEIIGDIEKYENRFSRFLPNSELSKLNISKNMTVSEDFMKVTKRARELFRITKGIFNPLVQIERMGYDKDFSKINENDDLKESEKYDIDFEKTDLNFKTNKIILRDGQKLDFGGFLKGYLAEILCKKIINKSSLIAGAIVNIGGDIHTQGKDTDGNKFEFDIFNPITKEEFPITLHNQSLATSGTYKRTWSKSGSTFHHILDSSGLNNPDSEIISSSVIGDDGGKAEAFAKVFLSLGEKGLEILPKENILYAFIKKDGSVTKNFL